MWSVPLRVSCPGPVLRLACLGGGGPVPVPPYLAWGCGGGGRASPWGVPSTVAWGVRGLALLFPRLPVHWVGCRDLCCGRGRAVVGAPLCSCGGGERCGLGVQAPVRRIPMTSPMRTELRPAGCVGGLGWPWLEWCTNVPVHGPAEHPYRGLTLSTGGGGCGRVCSVTRVPVYL